MRVKRIVFINRAPFHNLDLDFANKQVVSLTGVNGAGKTTIISYIVDAFYEIAKKSFGNEFSGAKEGKYYRVSSMLYNQKGHNDSLVYIAFDLDGEVIHYFDWIGNIGQNTFEKYLTYIFENKDISDWPLKYTDISNQFQNGLTSAKYITIDKQTGVNTFSNNILTYFPSYRYEQPGYLNDVYRMNLSYKNISDFSGYLINPVEVTSGLPEIANWIMDVVLDNQLRYDDKMLQNIQQVVSTILYYKQRKPVRFGIGPRNYGGARIQIVEQNTNEQVYPSIFNMSAGESSILCLFGELIKQADKINRELDTIEGIVLVDEIDKHLHIYLQKQVIPVLIKMFPKVQFIISTHSAFVNLGLTDLMPDDCLLLNLDNNGAECLTHKNNVFHEAYDLLISENEQYLYLYEKLNNSIEKLTRPVVYLEGQTDEKYFNKALEVFEYTNVNFDFQWIGHLNNNGNEEFSGSGSLNNGLNFLKGRNCESLHIFLFDSDTQRTESIEDNIIVMIMPFFQEHDLMNKGIENALNLDKIDIDSFYDIQEKKGDYGKVTTIKEFQKMKLCNYICSLEKCELLQVFANLKPVIDRIIKLVENKRNNMQ